MRFGGLGGALARAVGLLLLGQNLGFALAPLATAWPWAATLWLVAALAGWGWRLRFLVPALVLGLGLVTAARVEAARQTALEAHWRSGVGAHAPTVVLDVEGPVEIRPCRKGGREVCFPSHLGVMPLWVRLPLPDGARGPRPGEKIRCSGWVSRKSLHEGRFARRLFWGREMAEVAESPSVRMRLLSALSAACARRAALGLSWCPGLAALNRAILLGQRSALTPRERQMFVAAGTIHVFAISGLHVMLVAMMLVRVLGALGMTLRLRGVWALPLLALYVLMTGARPSAVRAGIMAGLCLAAPAFGRRGDPLAAWAVTALGVYGVAPERIHDVGCTFSFVVMLGLVAWMKWVCPLLPKRFRRGLWGMMGIAFAAWTAGVPVAAHLFGRVTWGGLVANLAVVNLAALTVAFGFTGICLGFVAPVFAPLFNNLAAGCTALMRWVSMGVAAVPGSSLEVSPWSLGSCLLWYLAWVAAFGLVIWFCRWRKGVWWG